MLNKFKLSEEDEQGINEILKHINDVFYDEIMGNIIESMPEKPDGATRIEALINQYRIFYLRGFEAALTIMTAANEMEEGKEKKCANIL